MFPLLVTGAGDVAASGLTITSKSVGLFSFSSPTFLSGLQLVTLLPGNEFFWLIFEPFVTSLWIAIFATGAITAHILWIMERQDNPYISMEYRVGILSALWISITSFFSAIDRKVVTIPGRLMMIAYFFISLVLFADYISDLTARLVTRQQRSGIRDYGDLKGKTVGTLMEYGTIMRQFGCKVQTYDQPDIASMIDDLKSGVVDALALEYPQALTSSTGDCRLTTAGGIFVPWFYAFAFPLSTDPALVQAISVSNLRLYNQHFHIQLQNLNMIESPDEECSRTIEIPLRLYEVAGLWVIIATMLVGFIPIYAVYRNYKVDSVEPVEEPRELPEKNKVMDFQSAAKIDLITKFDKILSGSDRKFKQKMKDLECALSQHNENSDLFEDSLIELNSKLKNLDNRDYE